MAHFYTRWAKKIPVNSEFHRVLLRNAAQFMKSLKGRGGGGGRGGGRRGLTANQLGQMKYEAPGQYLTEALTLVARDQLVIHGDETLDKVRLGVEENDPGAMVAIIDALNKNDPYRKEVMGVLHKMNPNIPADGQLTIGLYTSVLNRQANHINKRAWDELAAGHLPAFNTAIKARDVVQGLQRQAGAWQSTDHYYQARDDKTQIWDSPTQTAGAKVAAGRQYQTTLTGLRDDAIKRGDTRQAVSLQSEIDSLGVPVEQPDGSIVYVPDSSNAKPSLWEDFSTNSSSPSYQSEKGDAHTNAETMRAYGEVAQGVADHRLVYTYGTFSAGGKFTPSSGGNAIGAIDVRYLTQDPDAYKALPVAGAYGFEDVYAQGAPVMAVQQRPQAPNEFGYLVDVPLAEGEVQPDPVLVGHAYDVREGNTLVRIYGIPQGDGSEMYTAVNPFAVGVNVNFNQVTMNGQEVVAISVPAGIKSPYGFNDPSVVRDTNVVPAGLVMSPYLAKALATPEGIQQLAKFGNSPGEVMNYANGLYGPGTPKAIAAYGEILITGRDARLAAGTEQREPRPEVPGALDEEGPHPTYNPFGEGSMEALARWRNNYATAQGISAVGIGQKEAGPTIRLPNMAIAGIPALSSMPGFDPNRLPVTSPSARPAIPSTTPGQPGLPEPPPPYVPTIVMPPPPRPPAPVIPPPDMPAVRERDQPPPPPPPPLPGWFGSGGFGGH
jgi:hypothetical protein